MAIVDPNLIDRPDPSGLANDKEEKYQGVKSFLAGIGSGALKIPEGFFSLGATLYDLGAGTDTATEVELFFDNINPFDELAEETMVGKLTETFEDSDDELCEDEDEKDEIHDSNDDDNYYRVFGDFEADN